MDEHDDRSIDLTALDPTRDALRFERIVRSIAVQATAHARPGVPALAVRWWKPSLALAAALALATWAPQFFPSGGTAAAQGEDPGVTLLTWTSAPPTAAEVLHSLGSTP